MIYLLKPKPLNDMSLFLQINGPDWAKPRQSHEIGTEDPADSSLLGQIDWERRPSLSLA